jgi:uncharacterized protein (DUF1499 family)
MSHFVKLILLVLLAGAAGFGLLRWLVVMASPVPDNLGVRNGRLAPCPDSPNCVSTRATDSRHAIEAIPYRGDTAVAREQLLAILERFPQASIRTAESHYIHAEFRSRLWGFIDDVEFQLDEAAGLIHFRSAARFGYGDMGVNRTRLTAIQTQMAGQP